MAETKDVHLLLTNYHHFSVPSVPVVNNLLARVGAEDYTALAAQGARMQEVAQGQQADNAAVPQGTASVSVTGSAGTSVSLAAPSLGAASGATLNGGIVPQCTKYGITSYYATDHLGTVRFVKTVDDSGIVTTTTHDYEPFGVEITPTDACDNTHKFTGHERDIETGNDYMHFRFYGASIGRFQKPDSNFDSPVANPQGWNLYSYVKGNPVNFNDPTGHVLMKMQLYELINGAAWFSSGDAGGEEGGFGAPTEDPSSQPTAAAAAQPAAGATVAPGTTNNQAQPQAQQTKSSSNYVTVYLQNNANLTGPQMDVVANEIVATYSKAGITATVKSGSEYTEEVAAKHDIHDKVLLINSVAPKGTKAGEVGYVSSLGATYGIVYADRAAAAGGGARAKDLIARAIGRGGAHELGHMLNVADRLDNLPPNLMQQNHGNPDFWIGPRTMEHKLLPDDIVTINKYLSGGT